MSGDIVKDLFERKLKEQLNQKKLSSESTSPKGKSVQDVLNDLKEIERRGAQGGEVDAPESLNLQKVEFEEKTDDELSELAKNSLASKYNTKKQSTNDSFEKQIDNLLKQSEENKKQAESQKESVNEIFDNSIKETENQALKRGLARSSVIIGQVANLEGSRANELANILKDINDNLTYTENKISELENEKERALDDLDIEYAMELNEKIQSVKDDYNKQKQQAIEFNNNVEKLEAEYKLKLDDQKLQRQKQTTELKDKYGVDYAKEQIKDNQYEYMKNYVDSIDKDYAIDLLTRNKEFENLMGSNRYKQLLAYLEAK